MTPLEPASFPETCGYPSSSCPEPKAPSPPPPLLALHDASDAGITRTGMAVLGGAFGLACLSDVLLSPALPGLNLGVWTTGLAVTLLFLSRYLRIPLTGQGRWLLFPAVLFAFCAAWRDSRLLLALNLSLTGTCLLLAAGRSRTGRLWQASLTDYLLSLVQSGANLIGGGFRLVLGEIRWREAREISLSPGTRAVLRGLVLALPLLVIFGLLFVLADATFERLVTEVFQWVPGVSPARLLWIAFVTWLGAGFLRQFLLGKPLRDLEARSPSSFFTLGSVEANVALICLNFLFVGFVATQIPYLFGGAQHVATTTGLTLSTYVRRGFFELVTVAALVLPMLLAADWMVKKDSVGGTRLFRILSAVLVSLLFVIMTSAMQRMRLYTDSFGLTELRFYVSAFMLFLAALFVWFTGTVLRGSRESFAAGALVIGLGASLLVQAVNPDAWIARTNLRRLEAGQTTDVRYLAGLGGESVTLLLQAWPRLDESQRAQVVDVLHRRRLQFAPRDWRSWNSGRAAAARPLAEHPVEIRFSTTP